MSSTRFSSPRPSVTGLRPTVTNILSAGRLRSLPSAVSIRRPSPLGCRAERLGAGEHLDAERSQALRDRTGQFGIVERQDLVLRLDDGDLGTELGEGGAEFQPDIAAADHDEALRNLRQRQRAGRGDHVAAEGQEGQFDRGRAGRDDDRLGLDRLRAGLGLDDDRLAVAEMGATMNDLDLGLAQQAGDAVVEALDDAVLPGHGLLQVELRLGRGPGRRASCRPLLPPPSRTPRRHGSSPWRGCSRH